MISARSLSDLNFPSRGYSGASSSMSSVRSPRSPSADLGDENLLARQMVIKHKFIATYPSSSSSESCLLLFALARDLSFEATPRRGGDLSSESSRSLGSDLRFGGDCTSSSSEELPSPPARASSSASSSVSDMLCCRQRASRVVVDQAGYLRQVTGKSSIEDSAA